MGFVRLGKLIEREQKKAVAKLVKPRPIFATVAKQGDTRILKFSIGALKVIGEIGPNDRVVIAVDKKTNRIAFERTQDTAKSDTRKLQRPIRSQGPSVVITPALPFLEVVDGHRYPVSAVGSIEGMDH